MNHLPLAAAPLQTVDATVQVVVSYALPNDTWGELRLELSGENQNNPAVCYSWMNIVEVSCDASVATVRASGPSPTILDPALCGAVVSVTVAGASVYLNIAAPVAPWSWVGKISGILHQR